jgi:hypothetical protein
MYVIVTGNVTMDWILAAGWQYDPVTDKKNTKHTDLVPWEDISVTAQDKDRDFVHLIPNILSEAGFTIVKLRPMKAER